MDKKEFKMKILQTYKKTQKFLCRKQYNWYVLFGYVITFAILTFFSAILLLKWSHFSQHWVDGAKIATSALIFISIVLGIINYNYVKEWNRKKAAVEALHNSKKLLKPAIRVLDKEINIQEKIINNYVFTIQELHNIIGVFLKDGSFVFHGEETPKDRLKVHNKDNGFIKRFQKYNGREIYEYIEDILNEYEYLCMAANQNIFDKSTLIELRGSGIVRIFNMFSNHIYHLRHDKRHNFGGRLYFHLEAFATEIGEELELEVRKPKDDEYLSYFDRHSNV